MIASKPEHPLLRDISQTDNPKFLLEESVEILFTYNRKTYKELIPKGFTTDFGSIPKIFRNWLSNVSGYNKAYLLHDYQYTETESNITRKEADEILRENLKFLGMNLFDRNSVYFAVRCFGGKRWHD